jgi:hypothetical protein
VGCVQRHFWGYGVLPMRPVLAKYLHGHFRMFHPRPPLETLEEYEAALAGVSDAALEQALKSCMVECKFFPMPAHILERLPKTDFCRTTSHSDCPRCGGCGWDVTEYDADGYRVAIPCVCMKNRPARTN